jgi:tetratricopeptide (TPR) repeat protein
MNLRHWLPQEYKETNMKTPILISIFVLFLLPKVVVLGQDLECSTPRKPLTETERDQSTTLNKEGSRAYINKQYDKAFQRFTEAADRFPDDYRAWNNLAVYYSDIAKEYQKAIPLFRRSICLNPAFSSSRMSLGTAYYYLENYKEAREQLLKSLEINPNNTKARCNLSIVLIRMKKYTSAIEVLTETAQMPYDSIYINNLGAAYLYKKDYKKAAKYFKQAIKIDPKNTIFHFNLGVTYLSQKKKELAISQMKILQASDAYRADLLYKGIYADKLLFVEDVIK